MSYELWVNQWDKQQKELKNQSTVSREIKRNKGARGYSSHQAHNLACERRRRCANGPRVAEQTWSAVQLMIKEKWSPEQIAGRFKLLKAGNISHETIYQRLLRDKEMSGILYTNLRCQKKRRKRYGSGRNRHGQIIGRVPISERPEIVNQKSRKAILSKEKENFYNYSTRGFLCDSETKYTT